MKTPEITVDIAPDGTVKIEGHGFTGGACIEATKHLEAALGTPTSERQLKPEHRAQQTRTTPRHLRQ